MADMGFPGGSDHKESDCNMGDPGSIPGSGRSPGEGSGCPLQYSCLENSMDRGVWWATVHGITELDMTEQFNTFNTLVTVKWIRRKNAQSGSKAAEATSLALKATDF